MLPAIDVISVTNFRANISRALKMVTEDSGNLWLAKHGRPVCGIARMVDLHTLSAVNNRPMRELMERMETDMARMRAGREVVDRYRLAERDWHYAPNFR